MVSGIPLHAVESLPGVAPPLTASASVATLTMSTTAPPIVRLLVFIDPPDRLPRTYGPNGPSQPGYVFTPCLSGQKSMFWAPLLTSSSSSPLTKSLPAPPPTKSLPGPPNRPLSCSDLPQLPLQTTKPLPSSPALPWIESLPSSPSTKSSPALARI